jgi:hypothetical protein
MSFRAKSIDVCGVTPVQNLNVAHIFLNKKEHLNIIKITATITMSMATVGTSKEALSTFEIFSISVEYAKSLYTIRELRNQRLTGFNDLNEHLPAEWEFSGTAIRDAEALREGKGLSYGEMASGVMRVFDVPKPIAEKVVEWVRWYMVMGKERYGELHRDADRLSRAGRHKESAELFERMASLSERRQLPVGYVDWPVSQAMAEFKKAGMQDAAASLLCNYGSRLQRTDAR